jgi:hypothetical protein
MKIFRWNCFVKVQPKKYDLGLLKKTFMNESPKIAKSQKKTFQIINFL